MSETLQLTAQVQKAIFELNTLLKSKADEGFSDDVQRLKILLEMLQEQDTARYDHAE